MHEITQLIKLKKYCKKQKKWCIKQGIKNPEKKQIYDSYARDWANRRGQIAVRILNKIDKYLNNN